MIARILMLEIAALLLVPAACAPEGPGDESAAVRATFDGYRQAILDQRGSDAVKFVDTRTIDYYRQCLDLARHAQREKVADLSTTNRLMVLMIRHLIPPAVIAQMTPESLFVYAVDKGWIGRDSVVRIGAGEIVIAGDSASGVHLEGGQPTPLQWTFRKENDGWKIDLAAIMPVADQSFKLLIQRQGVSEDEFIAGILESVSGTKVDDAVWDPIVK